MARDQQDGLRLRAARKRRRDKRRSRGAGEEISELNITPMLDMMTILLVFLIKSYGASSENVNVENLVLPHSSTQLRTEEVLQVIVSGAAVLVDQKVVARLDAGRFRVEDLPEGPQGSLVRPLFDALAERAAYYRRIEENGGTAFRGRVAIVADKNTNYDVVYRVLHTCGRAEFGRFKLFVQRSSG